MHSKCSTVSWRHLKAESVQCWAWTQQCGSGLSCRHYSQIRLTLLIPLLPPSWHSHTAFARCLLCLWKDSVSCLEAKGGWTFLVSGNGPFQVYSISLCALWPTLSALHYLSTLINMSDRKPDNSQELVQMTGVTSFKIPNLNKLYLHFFGLQLSTIFIFHIGGKKIKVILVSVQNYVLWQRCKLSASCKLRTPMSRSVVTSKAATINFTHLQPWKYWNPFKNKQGRNDVF